MERWTPEGGTPQGAVISRWKPIASISSSRWDVQRARYMTLETMAPLSDDPFIKLPAMAA
jgi:hypothetical protein